MECMKEIEFSNEYLINLYKSTRNTDYLEMLYRKNFNLFYKLSYKYSSVSWEFTQEDLLQELYFSLIKAVENYKPNSVPFFSFLYMVCNQYLWRVCNAAGNRELAEKKKMVYVSIYKKLCEDKDGNVVQLLDTLIDETQTELINNLPEIMFIADLNKILNEAINTLPERTRTIIKSLNGFGSAYFTSVELAEIFGISKSRVQEIKSDAYRKLRQDKNLQKVYRSEFKHRY